MPVTESGLIALAALYCENDLTKTAKREQSQAVLIAATLNRHHAKATFFLFSEKTVKGDFSLDQS